MDQHVRHIPKALLERAPVPALTTINGVVMSVVYVTAPGPFTGVIGGTSTQAYDTDNQLPTHRATNTGTNAQNTFSTSTRPALTPTSSASDLYANQSPYASSSTYNYDPAATQTGVYTFGNGPSNDQPASSANNGLSIGAKIGLGAGIIAGIGFFAIIALFFLAKKRKQVESQAQADTEKKDISKPMDSNPNAPRLSLRPVSRILPEFMGAGQQKNNGNRSSHGNMLSPISEAGSTKLRSLSPVSPQSQGPQPSNDRSRNGDNPFRDPENPFKDPEKMAQGPVQTNTSPPAPIPSPTLPAIAVTAAEPARDQRISGPNGESFPLPQSQPPPQAPHPTQAARMPPVLAPIAVPPPSHYVELPAASSPGIAPGPGAEAPPGNVYRILMDFRPTMDDELELRAGQLVRMLHEYDDGWALCIRLDRSQQGVVPRTCLAVKPSKPRPAPSSMGPHGYPMGQQGRPRGPSGPHGSQVPPGSGFTGQSTQSSGPSPVQRSSLSPIATGEFNQPPRPLSPGPRPQPPIVKRSQSPGPYAAGGPKPMAPELQRRRSNSVGALAMPTQHELPAQSSNLVPGAPPPVRSNSPGLAI